MDCTSCDTTPVRPDRPHTFFAHELDLCPSCGTSIEARVVIRGASVVHLLRCLACGPQERVVSDDAATWVRAFLERGKAVGDGDHLFKHTTSTCPGCLALVRAEVVIRKDRV